MLISLYIFLPLEDFPCLSETTARFRLENNSDIRLFYPQLIRPSDLPAEVYISNSAATQLSSLVLTNMFVLVVSIGTRM